MKQNDAVTEARSEKAEMPGISRRRFVKNAALACAGAAAAPSLLRAGATGNQKRPNIVLIVADQFRADFVGAFGANPSTRTPNLDGIARRGSYFRNAVTNQPLCSPSRACMITGRYATETGVWKLGLELNHALPTLATVCKQNGYSTNFVGKWHLTYLDPKHRDRDQGWVPPGPSRGGFDDLWEGANVLELESHPYYGKIWDSAGKVMEYHNEYRVDFLTDRAVRFLEQPHDKPFLLYVSQLEPHHQNDVDEFVAPKGYAEQYQDPFVPPDLLHLPGNWQSRLPGYYGDVQRIDESVGRILKTLEKQGLLENTIVAFTSDHGCTFRTRKGEYKRSPHDSSIRIPYLFQGPGFDQSMEIPEIVSMIDLTPTLLAGAGLPVPSSMKGKNLMPLLTESYARAHWDNTAFIQISASETARAVRTKDWCYCAYDPRQNGRKQPSSDHYMDGNLYSIDGDPAELVNLVGRPEYEEITLKMRALLKKQMAQAGEASPEISASVAPY
jgi:arylsulfatase A-like enzyme